MTPQQLVQRALDAKAEFDAWVEDQLERDSSADPFSLVVRAINHFRQDPNFMGGWVAGTMQERIAQKLARRSGALDMPQPTEYTNGKGASSNGRGPGAQPAKPRVKRERRVAAPNTWRVWLETERVPVRTKLMRRTDLVEVISAERQEIATHATNIRLAEALITRLPEGKDDLTVGDVWTDAELEEIVRSSLAPMAPTPMVTDRCEKGAD